MTAKDDAARRAWLEQQGWQTEEQPVRTLTVQLSLAGQEDYLALQQEAGLPLADYDGQTVTRCTYTVTNYPGRTGDVQVNLYLCGDVIVGGDIMALGENGFQASLLGGEYIVTWEEGPLPLPPMFQYSSPSVMICAHSTGPTAPVGSKPSCRWRVSTAC